MAMLNNQRVKQTCPRAQGACRFWKRFLLYSYQTQQDVPSITWHRKERPWALGHTSDMPMCPATAGKGNSIENHVFSMKLRDFLHFVASKICSHQLWGLSLWERQHTSAPAMQDLCHPRMENKHCMWEYVGSLHSELCVSSMFLMHQRHFTSWSDQNVTMELEESQHWQIWHDMGTLRVSLHDDPPDQQWITGAGGRKHAPWFTVDVSITTLHFAPKWETYIDLSPDIFPCQMWVPTS